MMKLVLVRHGQSTWNLENRFTGWTDVPLTDKGRQEAYQAGQLLLDAGYDFDVVLTSVLRRAIHTADLMLETMDRVWLPMEKDWRLNERHYGALQGLNKAETAAEYGEAQVLLWRRSFDVPPPPLAPDDPRNPHLLAPYRGLRKAPLPLGESLADTIERVRPYFDAKVLPAMRTGSRVLVVAHGNSIRAIVQMLETLTPEGIMGVEIPTGIPLVYTLGDDFSVVSREFLGDALTLAARVEANLEQGKAKET